MPSGIKLEDVDVWFQDETRVGQQGSLTRTWARRGTRPRLVKQQGFISTYIFGAVCPANDTGRAIIVPLSNTECMNKFLVEVSAAVPDKRHGVVILDNATWHKSEGLIVPPNISLINLPAYSPELNAAEQVWEYLKQKDFSNCFFDDYDALLEATCNAWNNFVSEVGRIKSLCTREWAIL